MEEYAYIMRAVAALAAAFTIGFGALGPAIAQGLTASKACENIGKYPESANDIRNAMFLGLVFPETLVIFCLLIAGAILFFFR